MLWLRAFSTLRHRFRRQFADALNAKLSSPIAQHSAYQRERRDRSSIRAQDAGAEREPHDIGKPTQHGTFLRGKATFGTDQDCDRQGFAGMGGARRRKRGDRILNRRFLVAKHQEAPRIPVGDNLLEAERSANLRQRQDAALLRRLDCIGVHATNVHTCNLDMPGDDRLKTRGAHFDGLLDHVIQSGMLEGREQEIKVGTQGLGAGLRPDRQRKAPL